MVHVTVHGGSGEIGGNKILVEDGEHRLFLDFGMSFGRHGAYFAEFLKPRTRNALTDLLRLEALPKLDGVYRQDCCQLDGVDPLIDEHGYPDLWCAPVQSHDAYVAENGKPFVDAVILSHAHMDHFGHFPFLDPKIPVYGTPVTLAALRAIARVSGGGLDKEYVSGKTWGPEALKSGPFQGQVDVKGLTPWERPLTALAPYARHEIPGTPFAVTLIPVDHSIPGAASVLVECDGKTIYYSGDVRFHGLHAAETQRLWERVTDLEPDLFLCEGTRITSDASDSEAHVRETLTTTFRGARGLCLVDFAWKDTTRFVTLQQVAEQTGRVLLVSHKLAFMLRKLHEADPARFHPAEHYKNVRVYVKRMGAFRYTPADYRSEPLRLGYHDGRWADAPMGDADTWTHLRTGVTAVDVRKNPGSYILMLSQHEMQELIDLDPPRGSAFVRAACEPFSDEMDLDLQRQARWLQRFDVPVKESGNGSGPLPVSLHASGHASGPDIRKFAKRVNAKRLIPVHTEREDGFDGVDNVTPVREGVRVTL